VALSPAPLPSNLSESGEREKPENKGEENEKSEENRGKTGVVKKEVPEWAKRTARQNKFRKPR